MTHWTARYIEQTFKEVASLRISQKRRGDDRYKGDAGYWDGGRCNYGGAHNLQEDCQTLAKLFTEITELKDARKKLLTFNNQEEFERNKQNLLTKADQAINGLKMETGTNTSIGGVCCIWKDFSHYLNRIVDDFRRQIESLRGDIERVPYNEAKELQKLNQEERKLQKEIEENRQKAEKESDPEKKKKFLFLIEDAKAKWKKVLERKSQLKSSSLGDSFNPDKHISDFFAELENKLSGRNKPLSNPRVPNTNPTNSKTGSNIKDPLNPFQPTSNSNQNFLQSNQPLIILGAIVALLILYFYYSQEEELNYYDF